MPLRLSVAAVGVIALLLGQAAVAMIICIALVSHVMPGQVFQRCALALVSVFGVNVALLTACSVLAVAWRPDWLLAGLLAIAAVLPPAERRTGPGLLPRPDVADLFAAVCGAVTLLVFALPFTTATSGRALALLTGSTDAGRHLHLVRAMLRERGYVHLMDALPGVLPGMQAYPGGWAGGVAAVAHLLGGPEQDVETFIAIAATGVVGGFALLAYFAARVAFDLASALGASVSLAGAAMGAVCLTLSFVFGSTTLLLYSASYAQIAGITALLACLSVVLQQRGSATHRSVLLSIGTVALFHTWYLLAPLLLVVLVHHLHVMRKESSLRSVALVAVPTALVALYPLVTGPKPVAQLTIAGSAPGPGSAALLALSLLAAATATYLLTRAVAARWEPQLVAILIVGTLFMAAAALVAQQLQAPGNHYYAIKLLYVTFLLGCIAASGILMSRISGSPALSTAAVALVVATVLSATSLSLRGQLTHFVAGKPRASASALDAMLTERPHGPRPAEELWIVGNCRRTSDFIASQWPLHLFLRWTSDVEPTLRSFVSAQPHDLTMLIERSRRENVHHMRVYASRGCDSADLDRLAASPKVQVIHA